jgi:HEAT repeat protein
VNNAQKLLVSFGKVASRWRVFFISSEAEEIHKIISALLPLNLAALDVDVRRLTYYKDWYEFRPSGVKHLAQSKFATSLVGLASFHNSGYVRAAAVKELASLHTGKELPFLLIRLNDWVAEIRDAATQAVRERMEPAYAIHFLANISLVLRLRSCGRVDKHFVDEICHLLKSPECNGVLQEGMISVDKIIRRISFQLAAEADPSSRAAIIRAAMMDSDQIARCWAVQHLLPEIAPEELPGMIEPMLKDRYMPVRRTALWEAATKRPDLASDWLRSALLDNHVSVRETARQFLPVAGVNSVRSLYSAAVQNGDDNRRPAAICGLGETGTRDDIELIKSYLSSNPTKLRRAAVYALGKLDSEGQFETLVAILSDSKASVSWEAMKAVFPRARYIPLEILQNLMNDNSFFHVRRNALTLILRTDKWKKMAPLLNACASSDARLAERAVKALYDWEANYNRSFAEPTREDFEKIVDALDKFKEAIPRKHADNLRACLKIYF